MKVAYVLHRFPSVSETFVLLELCWIRRHFEAMHVFSLLPPKPGPIHEEAKEWLPVTEYSALLSWDVLGANAGFLRRSPRRYLRALVRTIRQTYREPAVLLLALALFPKSVYFARRMQELEIAHLHAHFVWLGGIAAGVAADLLGLTYTIHAHAFDIFERNRHDVQAELEGAAKIITISSYHRSTLASLCPERDPEDIQIVHLGVDTDRFRPPAEAPSDEPLSILSIGRLVEKKGHTYLIDACKLLTDQGLAYRCRIVGDGPLRQELQAQIDRYGLQEQVMLCGALDHEAVLKLHQSSHIFALAAVVARSGDQDGMPYVLIEAMACGLPVITTPISGIPDLVCHDENGLLVEQRNAAALADALTRLATDKEGRRLLGRNARQTVLREFQIQRNTEKLAAIFGEAAQAGVHAHTLDR